MSRMSLACLVIIGCLAGFTSASAQLVGAYTVTIHEEITGIETREEVAIIAGDEETFSLHRAQGDTVTIYQGFKMDNIYGFRDFRSGGSLIVCKIEDDDLCGLIVSSRGSRKTMTSDTTRVMRIGNRSISGRYHWQAEPYIPSTPVNVLSINPGNGCWSLELNYGDDQFTEIKGVGIEIEGVLFAAMDLVENNTTWNLNAYRFDNDGNAQGRWMSMAIIEPTQETKTYTGNDKLTLVIGLGQ